MSALNRKIFRDLLQMKGQMLAICLVMACGVAMFVMSLSTLDSLRRTLDAYYDNYRFADVFVQLKRAPTPLAERLAEIPGVGHVQTRIVEAVTLDMPGLNEPAAGMIVSLAAAHGPALNDLYLRSGRMLEAGRRAQAEVLVAESFAKAHGLQTGDSIRAIMHGRMEELRIAGIVLSPEFIYLIRSGELIPDDKRFGVFWMHEDEMRAAFDMDGAFNNAAISLMRGASEPEVIRRVDALTARYGGLGAYGREEQISHKFVTNEMRELRGMGIVIPIIFLAVAAFLLHSVLARLIGMQREQIASLKALGYSRIEIGWHYVKMEVLMIAPGTALGGFAGAWMGSGLTRMYTRFFHFPEFGYHLDPAIFIVAAMVCIVAGMAATLGVIRRAMRLPPAEAMRPQPPASFRPTILERLGLQRMLSPAMRMILRQLERSPGKAALSCLGLAMAVAVLILGNYMHDAIEFAMDFEFSVAQRQDVMVSFTDSRSTDALAEIDHIPGVVASEPVRAIAARIRAGHLTRRVGILGLTPTASLFRLVDMGGKVRQVPEQGLVISKKLAEILRVQPGDEIQIEVLQESRPIANVRIDQTLDDFSGTSAYMHIDAMGRLMKQGRQISGAFIAADPLQIHALYSELKESPNVASVTIKDAALESFRSTIAENLMRMRMVNVIFSVIIACGVVYNSARISLSERSRDLATLRVLGFTRAEISMIQLGELAVLTLLAVPFGCALGFAFAMMTSLAYNTEMFRIPLVVEPSTYGFAVAVVLLATIVAGLIVRRMLDRLDLVAVLKAGE